MAYKEVKHVKKKVVGKHRKKSTKKPKRVGESINAAQRRAGR